jgi:hypothetical protein
MRRAVGVCGTWSLVIGFGAAAAPPAVAQTPRAVYVSVIDPPGAPVANLQPGDFTLKEGGREYALTSVTPPSVRMHLVVVVEQMLAADTSLRVGIFELARALVSQADISLVLVANRAETITGPTGDLSRLADGLNAFLMRQTRMPGNFVEGIYDTARSIEALALERPAIVAVALEMPQTSAVLPSRVLDQLRRSRAVFHAITLTTGPVDIDVGALTDMAARATVLGDGPEQSGGRHIEVPSTAGIPHALDRVVRELSAQYRLTYTLPAGVDPSSRLDVSYHRDDAELRAPSRIAN